MPPYRIRRKRGVAQTFTAEQAAKLMEHMETYDGGRWVPYFALCLFAGIRPGVPYGEISKFKPDAVNLNDSVIHISAEVSKVREPRKVTIQPNLAAWLRAYPLEKFPIILGNFKKTARPLRQEIQPHARRVAAHVHFNVRREILLPKVHFKWRKGSECKEN